MFSQVVALCLLINLYAVESEELCQHKSTKGRDYKGAANTTVSGNPCQKWSDVTWDYPNFSHMGDHNLCRNPIGSVTDKVWCYTVTTDEGWENCSVPFSLP